MIAISESTPVRWASTWRPTPALPPPAFPVRWLRRWDWCCRASSLSSSSAFLKAVQRQSGRQGDLHGAETTAVAALILCAALNLVNVSVINLGAFQTSGSLMDLFPLKYYSVRCIIILNDENQKHPIVWIAPVGGGRCLASVLIYPLPRFGGVFITPQRRLKNKLHVHFPPAISDPFCDAQCAQIKNPQSNRGQF